MQSVGEQIFGENSTDFRVLIGKLPFFWLLSGDRSDSLSESYIACPLSESDAIAAVNGGAYPFTGLCNAVNAMQIVPAFNRLLRSLQGQSPRCPPVSTDLNI